MIFFLIQIQFTIILPHITLTEGWKMDWGNFFEKKPGTWGRIARFQKGLQGKHLWFLGSIFTPRYNECPIDYVLVKVGLFSNFHTDVEKIYGIFFGRKTETKCEALKRRLIGLRNAALIYWNSRLLDLGKNGDSHYILLQFGFKCINFFCEWIINVVLLKHKTIG